MGQTSLFYRLFDMLPLASYKWASAFLVFPSPAASYKLQSTREVVPRVVFSRIPTGWLPCFSLCGGRSHSVTTIQTGLSGLESTRWKRSSTIRQSSPRSFHRSPINSLTPVLSTLQRRPSPSAVQECRQAAHRTLRTLCWVWLLFADAVGRQLYAFHRILDEQLIAHSGAQDTGQYVPDLVLRLVRQFAARHRAEVPLKLNCA